MIPRLRQILSFGLHPPGGISLWLYLLLSPVMLSANETLLENSPFLPPGFGESSQQKEEAPPDAGPLSRIIEFRSVIRISDQWLFSLYNLQEKKSVWVGLEEEDALYFISEYNEDRSRLLISYNNQEEWLSIKESSSGGNPQAQTQTPVERAPGIRQERSSGSRRPTVNRRPVPSRRQVTVPRRNTNPN